jgi:hypothetical protein
MEQMAAIRGATGKFGEPGQLASVAIFVPYPKHGDVGK